MRSAAGPAATASLVGAFTAAGLVIRVLEELSGAGTVLPRNIGLVAEKA